MLQDLHLESQNIRQRISFLDRITRQKYIGDPFAPHTVSRSSSRSLHMFQNEAIPSRRRDKHDLLPRHQLDSFKN